MINATELYFNELSYGLRKAITFYGSYEIDPFQQKFMLVYPTSLGKRPELHDSYEDAEKVAQTCHAKLILNEVISEADVLSDTCYVIPKEMTAEEWQEVKYNVDRKADPDIPLWRIQEAIRYADFVASHRADKNFK